MKPLSSSRGARACTQARTV